MKYNLKGPKAGQYEVFVDALPGIPDNIKSDGQGGFIVCLIIVIDPEYPQFDRSLMPHPYLRKMLVRLLVTMELPFKRLRLAKKIFLFLTPSNNELKSERPPTNKINIVQII
jgi:hypothetical protein